VRHIFIEADFHRGIHGIFFTEGRDGYTINRKQYFVY
jgi:hypothetical protein